MRCLFIGGLNAGSVNDVDPDREYIQLHEPIKTDLPPLLSDSNREVRDEAVRITTYRRHLITDKDGSRYYVYHSTDIKDPLVELMDFYRSRAKGESQ